MCQSSKKHHYFWGQKSLSVLTSELLEHEEISATSAPVYFVFITKGLGWKLIYNHPYEFNNGIVNVETLEKHSRLYLTDTWI